MMKAVYKTHDGKTVLLIGLSFENLDRLREHELNGSITIKAEDLGLANDIIITCAETEQKMMQAMAQFVTPETKLKIDDRFKG